MKKVYLIAVVFALLAGLATYMFATQIDKKTTYKDAETVKVVVALQDIPKNTMITEDMFAEDAGYFATKNFVVDAATPEYIDSFDKIKDKVSIVDIYANEQLSAHKFVGTEDESVGLSYKLTPGKVAYSFSASTTNGVDGYICAGDVVDIITYENVDDKPTTKVAYKGLNVIRISSASANAGAETSDAKITEYSTITVEVTEAQALQLYNIENSKTFKLVLNSKKTEEKKAAQGAQQAQPAAGDQAKAA